MKFGLSLRYALKTFTGRRKAGEKRRSHLLLPMFAIALSLVPVIVILVVADGMIEGIIVRFLEFDTGHMRLTLSYSDEIEIVKKRLPALRQAEGIVYASLELQGGGLLYSKGKRSFVNIRAVPRDLRTADRGFARCVKLVQGGFDLERNNSIVIGQALAEEYRLAVGDTFNIFTHRSKRLGGRTVVQARATRFTVTGIYTIGYQELDKSTVFISFADGERALAPTNSYTHLKLKVADPFTDIEGQASRWEKFIDPQAVFWRLYTWKEINGNYYNAYESTKVLLVFLMLILVIVAALNNVSSMIMTVLDHLPEIAILKSLGASAGSIVVSFTFVGFLAGLFSTAAGIGAGLLIGTNINALFSVIEKVLTALSGAWSALLAPFGAFSPVENVKILNPEFYLESIPIRIEYGQVLGVGLFTLGLSIISSFFPALIAGRIRPLQVIQKH